MLTFFKELSNSEEDFINLHQLKSLKKDIFWSGYEEAPNKSKLLEWYNEQLVRTDRKIWLAFDCINPSSCVGYFYLTFEDNVAIASIGVNEGFNGKGIGSHMVNFMINILSNKFLSVEVLRAWIVEENAASIKVFLKNGFKRMLESKEVYYKSFDKTLKLICFDYQIRQL
jgi:RimJ/RimL family protein N-acetyltransferase